MIRIDKSGYSYLIFDLRGQAFSPSPLSYDISCELVIYGLNYVEV